MMTKKQLTKLFEDRKVRTVWDDEQEKWCYGLKGQHHTAQGNALGTRAKSRRPERAEAYSDFLLLPFQGGHDAVHTPKALPWAMSFLPLRDVVGAIADNHKELLEGFKIQTIKVMSRLQTVTN